MNLRTLFCPLCLLTLLIRESSLEEIVPSSKTATKVEASNKNDSDVFVNHFSRPESIAEPILTTTIAGESSLNTKKIKELEVPKESNASKKFEKIEDSDNSTKKENPAKPIESEDPKECPAESLTCTNPLNEEGTKQFDCEKKKCPANFFCCKDNCFKHKICKEPSSSTNGSDIKSSRVREVCPTNDDTCVLPADIKNANFCTDGKCPSGLKCCPDGCFKNNVCKKPDVLIEARIEDCPEEPKTCNSFLRDMKIEPRYICNVNMSNCPDDYKCCSDNCHSVNLCKEPKVHVIVQKLIPVTTYPDAGQNGTGPVPGKQNATTPQPAGNQTTVPPTPSSPTTPQPAGNQSTTVSPTPSSPTSPQPVGNQSTTVSHTPSSPTSPQPAGNQSTTVSHTPSSPTSPQPAGKQRKTVSQTPSSQNAITSSRTTVATVSQTPTSQPHQSTTITVSQTTTHPPTTQNPTTPKLNDHDASSVQPLG